MLSRKWCLHSTRDFSSIVLIRAVNIIRRTWQHLVRKAEVYSSFEVSALFAGFSNAHWNARRKIFPNLIPLSYPRTCFLHQQQLVWHVRLCHVGGMVIWQDENTMTNLIQLGDSSAQFTTGPAQWSEQIFFFHAVGCSALMVSFTVTESGCLWSHKVLSFPVPCL